MLIDSSVWIDFLRGVGTGETRLLQETLQQGEPLWLAPPILQEVLQGADSPQRFDRWDRILGELPMIVDGDIRGLTRETAKLYARCRWQGFTPRSANDCLIATYAIRFELPLLHRDRDFEHIAKVERKLKLLTVNR
jgi:predicted nucleic acid-binding protein